MSNAQLAAITNEKFINLTTFRRDGRAVPTVVWFALDGERLLVWTGPNSGKVKRIRRNARVTVAACNRTGRVTGETWSATAAILPEREAEGAMRLLNKKYGLIKRLIDGAQAIRRAIRRTPSDDSNLFLAITPV